MPSRSRRIRHLGGLVLLLAWAPVATANAVTCAVWCELNGGLSGHHAAAVHGGHDHGGAPLQNTGTVTNPGCSSPDLLVILAIAPDALVLPSATVTVAEPPVASPISIIVAYTGSKTPPPRF